MNTRIVGISALILTAACTTLLRAQTPIYKITKTFVVGGDGRWDYVVPDPPQHRLFIGRTNRVMVIDENDGKLLGEVMGIDGAHGTAVAEKSGHGFATPQASRNLGLDPTNHRLYMPAADFAPAAANARPSPTAGTFRILVIERSPGK